METEGTVNDTDTKALETNSEPSKPAAPDMSQEKIQEIVKAAIESQKAASPAEPRITEKQITELLNKQRIEIAKSVAGVKEADPTKPHPLVQSFNQNPAEFIERLTGLIKEEVRGEQKVELEQRTRFDNAYLSVLSERPDVMNSKNAMKVFLNFYDETSEDREEEERFKLALDKYDVFLEEQGGVDASARINKARGMSLNTSDKGGSAPEKKSAEEILREEQKEEKEHFLRSRGRL